MSSNNSNSFEAPKSSKKKKKSSTGSSHSRSAVSAVTYHGMTINTAAQQGNLPICVLLWGMAAAKRLSLMVPDLYGNNPMHYAALADSPEVMGFFHQQMKGVLSPDCSLVDSRNDMGETPLLRAARIGKIAVIRVSWSCICNPTTESPNVT